MSFSETFQIVNNSNYTLVLDQTGSDNLGDGEWPTSIGPQSTAAEFTQTGFFSVNPTAVYAVEGISPPVNIYMHFYCVGVDPALHVNMTMTFSPGPAFSGSSIAENNSTNGHSWNTNDTTLDISETGNGSSRGTAIFTVGTK